MQGDNGGTRYKEGDDDTIQGDGDITQGDDDDCFLTVETWRR